MPPPQCPECGRFLATAFVQQITAEAAPCPRCGTALYLGDGTVPTMPQGAAVAPEAPDAEHDDSVEVTEAVEVSRTDVVAQAAAVEETVEIAPDHDDDDDDDDVTITLDEDVPTPPVAVAASASTVAAAAAQDDQELQSLTGAAQVTAESVRPVDLAEDGASRDPLAGWDVGPTKVPAPTHEADPTVLAAGAGAGLLVGLLLGGRGHRGLGAALGAALGAVLARLRG